LNIFEGLTNKQIRTLFFGALMLIGVGYLAYNVISVNRDERIWQGVSAAVAAAVPKSVIAHSDSYAQSSNSGNADYCVEVQTDDWNALGVSGKKAVEAEVQAAISASLRGTRYSSVRIHVIHYPQMNMPHICAPSEPIYDEYFTSTVRIAPSS